MKLIRELNEEVEILSEANEDGKKNLYIQGIFLQSGIKNRNGRIYPESVMDNEVGRYLKESVKKRTAFGELSHPDTPKIDPERISHRIVEMTKDGKNWVGKAIVTNTPMGDVVRGLIESGGAIGVSSRALGSLKKNSQGIMEVQNDFKLSTAADVVLDPSAPDAWVQGIVENVEWFYDAASGSWLAQELTDVIKEEVKKNTLNEEKKLTLFNSFIENLKNSY